MDSEAQAQAILMLEGSAATALWLALAILPGTDDRITATRALVQAALHTLDPAGTARRLEDARQAIAEAEEAGPQ